MADPTPIAEVLVDGAAPDKAGFRGEQDEHLIHAYEDADAARGRDLTSQFTLYLRDLNAYYDRDPSDTTSADDGDTVIIDGGGNRWKKQTLAGAVRSVNGTSPDGAGNVALDADDIDDSATTNKFATAAEKAKIGYLAVTGAVDLDAVNARVNDLDAAVVLRGSWDASSGSFPGGGSAQAGDSYIVSVGGTVDGVAFSATDRVIAIADNASTATYTANWLKADYSDIVTAVVGQTGNVTAAQILAALLGEDGAGSGLDADKLDGNEAAAFATAAQGALADSAVQPARSISTDAPLAGGGDLSGNRTLSLSVSALTEETSPASSDLLLVQRASDSAYRKVKFSNLPAGGGGSDTAGIERDIRLLALRQAADDGDRINMVDGIADPLDDTSDIDTGGSSNIDTGTAGLIKPTAPTSGDQCSGGTASGQTESSAASNAFANDGTSSEWQNTSAGTPRWIRYQFAGAVKVTRVRTMWSYTGNKAYTLQYSDDGSSWNDAGSTGTFSYTAGNWREDDFSDAGAHVYWRLNITTYVGSTVVTLAECEMIDLGAAPDNMDCRSNAITADAAPDTGRLHLQVGGTDAGTLTLNTDLIAYMSRDGGTTWQTASLAAEGQLADGTRIFEDTAIDLSGQPSGTSMKWRVATANGVDIELRGVVEQWV